MLWKTPTLIISSSLVLNQATASQSRQCVDGQLWTQATATNDASNRRSHSSVVYKGKMWSIGGIFGSARTNDVWSSPDGTEWTEETSAAAFDGRQSHCSVVHNDLMWVMGGYSFSFAHLNDVWSSSDGVTWTEATSSADWYGRRMHSCLSYNNLMWVFGGTESTTRSNDVWSSADGVSWTLVTSAASWADRYLHSSVVFNNLMWIIGGSPGNVLGSDGIWRPVDWNDVWSSSDGVTWTEATSAASWTPRRSHETVVYNGLMYVMGGVYDETHYSDIWSSSNGVSWTKVVANAPWSNRRYHSSVVFMNKMWIIGGLGDDGSTITPDVWSTTSCPDYEVIHPDVTPRSELWAIGLKNAVRGSYSLSAGRKSSKHVKRR